MRRAIRQSLLRVYTAYRAANKKGRFRVLFYCKHAAYAFYSGFGRGFFFFFAAEKPNLPIFLPRAKYSP